MTSQLPIMKIYNNLTRQKEDFTPLSPGVVKFYSCGPTTYDFFHIGNARAFITSDLFHRVFKVFGYQVTFVRNYTDVDDKIIDRANTEGVNPLELAQRFVKECEHDMESLNLLPPTHKPKVSDSIPEIISMIKELVENGSAYVVDGEVLFHVPNFKDYGKLSKIKLDDLQHGKRVEVDAHKKHSSDFVLWKPAKAHEPSWDSPWGKGRPGWHIECSAMAKKFLGPRIDLHHGAVDLLFPHHENEIAQSEACNGVEFCHTWAHNEFLNFGHEKMSKSLGNFITARKFVEGFSGEILRHILLSVHYRSKIEWNEELILKSITEIERLHLFALDLKKAFINGNIGEDHYADLLILEEKIRDDLMNDFNVPSALGHIFSMIKEFNRIQKMGALHTGYAKKLKEIVLFFQEATGLFYKNPDEVLKKLQTVRKNLKTQLSKADVISSVENSEAETNTVNLQLTEEQIADFIAERIEAKKKKDFQRSDEIRMLLQKHGVNLKDNSDGTTTWSY